MKSFIYKCFIGGSVALSMTLSSCLGDLDLKPIDDNVIQLSDFKDNPQYYTQLLAKVYAGLAVSGQEGPAGNPDIQGFDEGQAQYLRAYWNLQELPTDEAVLGWNDAGLPELSMSTWSAANGFVHPDRRLRLPDAYLTGQRLQQCHSPVSSIGLHLRPHL